ncbi:MAG: DUF4982 domain-containing protein [Clostridia bacterium]|nr:DUF4982 domain-containing protein [Clostridia bacterium]
MREELLFDKGWLFHLGDIDIEFPAVKGPAYIMAKTQRMKMGPASVAYNDRTDDFRMDDQKEIKSEKWINVELPHDFMVTEPVDEQNNNALGFVKYKNAWYRKHFSLPEEDKGKRITLLFDGIATHATVYLNGCLMKHNFCGYTSFEVDISDVVEYGKDNVLAVYVVTTDWHEGWWYEGGGIYRHVHLIKTAPICAELWGVYAAPVKTDNGSWSVKLETTVLNETYTEREVRAVTRIVGADGATIGEAEASGEIELKGKLTLKYTAAVSCPKLWDIDAPNLYDVITDIYSDGELTDTYKTRCGFRTVKMDPNEGFFLNGRHVKIQGVCCHHGCGLTGKAVPDNVLRYQVELMKEMGANGYRTSHYPQAAETMDALDELGFIVMDETRWFESTDEGKEQLTMLMKRDRNRPSVFFWSVGNEEPHHGTEVGRRICKTLMALAHKLDDTRCIMTAVDHPERATVYDELEAVGVNYNDAMFESFHEKYPEKPMFSSECAAAGTSRGWYQDDAPSRGRVSAYDHNINNYFISRENTLKLHDKPWVMGVYIWTGLEYRGEAAWPRLCSCSGAIDLFLQRKDAFYQLQAFWRKEPMVHLLPHWNWEGYEGRPIRVSVYSNCDEVALMLNGKELGRRKLAHYDHAEWQVEYAPGTIEAIAYKNGIEVARDSKITSGVPRRLKLKLDSQGITANGRDMAIVTCYAEDENGLPVPTASPLVSFNCNSLGKIYSTGSDNCDHVPITCPDRRMWAGLATATVKLGELHGTLTVTASADGLIPAILDIDI